MRVTVGHGHGWLPLVAVAATCGCGGGETRHLTLSRVDPPIADGCPPPADALTLEIFALGDFADVRGFSDDIGEPIATDLFPADTRAFALQVLGAGGTVRSIGRTGTLDLNALPDGTDLPVFMAPPRSFCKVGSLAQARVAPIVVRAGAGVLVAGGGPGLGAEWYDPATGAFAAIADPPFTNLAGGRGVVLASGDVLLVWAGGYQRYDPDTRQFGSATLPDATVGADAQVVRLRDGTVLVAGGCAIAPCLTGATTDTAIYDPATERFTAAAPLALPRAHGSALLDADGAVWLVGGLDATGAPQSSWERWTPGGADLTTARPGAIAAALPSGGFLAAFAPDLAPPADAAAVTPSYLAGTASATARAPRAGASLIALEDGAVLAIGGVAPGAAATVPEAELYRPADNTFVALDPGALAGRRTAPGLALLDDGTVLVVGGMSAGAALTDAYIYRHDVTGPWSSVPIQTFGGDGAPLVVPGDPAHASILPASPQHPVRLVLDADPAQPGPLAAWAVLAGPTYLDVTATATLSTSASGIGVAFLFGMTSPGDFLAVRAVPGELLTLVAVQGGVVSTPLCTGQQIPIDGFFRATGSAVNFGLEVRAGRVVVTLDGATMADCAAPAPQRGHVGVGLLGAGDLGIDALAVSR